MHANVNLSGCALVKLAYVEDLEPSSRWIRALHHNVLHRRKRSRHRVHGRDDTDCRGEGEGAVSQCMSLQAAVW